MTQHDEAPELLRRIAFLRTLDDDQLQQVAGLLREQTYRKGEVIFQQHDPGGCMYLIAQGRVRIYLEHADGREVTIRIYGSGSYFGEFSVLDGATRSASTAALTDVTTFVLYRDDFLGLLRSHFTLVEHVLTALTERLRYTTTYSEYLAFLSAPERVAATLVQLATSESDTSDPVRLTLTQQDLAALANTTREWVNRALRDFAEQGMVEVERGAVVILDRARLERLIQ
jgi:CRP-like cAMP-binding protein